MRRLKIHELCILLVGILRMGILRMLGKMPGWLDFVGWLKLFELGIVVRGISLEWVLIRVWLLCFTRNDCLNIHALVTPKQLWSAEAMLQLFYS